MSPPLHNSHPALTSAEISGQEFSSEERAALATTGARFDFSPRWRARAISLDPPTPHLAEPRGAFTSLYLRGELRGCVGYVLVATSPLYRAVAETARAAAFDDNRFPPVTQRRSLASRNRAQCSLAAAIDPCRCHRNRTTRPSHQSARPPRPATATSRR